MLCSTLILYHFPAICHLVRTRHRYTDHATCFICRNRPHL